MVWRNKSVELERIEGQVWIAGNLTIRITKLLNTDAGKTEDPEKTEGNLFNGTMDSGLGSFVQKSISGLM